MVDLSVEMLAVWWDLLVEKLVARLVQQRAAHLVVSKVGQKVEMLEQMVSKKVDWLAEM